MAKVLETEIQKRFSDVDPFQHVNNVSQQMYFDVGKMEFYEKVLGAEVLQELENFGEGPLLQAAYEIARWRRGRWGGGG